VAFDHGSIHESLCLKSSPKNLRVMKQRVICFHGLDGYRILLQWEFSLLICTVPFVSNTLSPLGVWDQHVVTAHIVVTTAGWQMCKNCGFSS
jgi:hypothetical protein